MVCGISLLGSPIVHRQPTTPPMAWSSRWLALNWWQSEHVLILIPGSSMKATLVKMRHFWWVIVAPTTCYPADLSTCIAHWRVSLSSRQFHHTKQPCFRLDGSCAKGSARQKLPNGHFRVQPDTVPRTLHLSCPYVLIKSVSGKINS